uniref:RNase H domain-containing protein n=1 Tax=Haemonchus contortus TaxID=6289 RepID=A0A7I4Z3V3_HAECO
MNENHAKQWAEIVEDISEYQHQLPRRIVRHQAKHTIVTFSNASTMAMAACAYLSNAEEANFLMAKSKVADPKKPATIPKVELNAMTIAARLAYNILLSINPLLLENVLFLCYSEIALNWLQCPKHQQGTGKYVSNRIKEIHKIVREIEGMSINVQIGYVDTKHNPADCATRGLASSKLMNHSWWKGYTLKGIQNNCYVSKLNTIQEEDGEPESAVTNHLRTTTNEDETERKIVKISAYNDLRKVRRIVEYALKFLKGIHSRLHCTLKEKLQTSLPWTTYKVGSRNLSIKERKDAETLFITQHQVAHLQSQYRKELVNNLDVRGDKNHILRAHGRLNKANQKSDRHCPKNGNESAYDSRISWHISQERRTHIVRYQTKILDTSAKKAGEKIHTKMYTASKAGCCTVQVSTNAGSLIDTGNKSTIISAHWPGLFWTNTNQRRGTR